MHSEAQFLTAERCPSTENRGQERHACTHAVLLCREKERDGGMRWEADGTTDHHVMEISHTREDERHTSSLVYRT